MGHKNVTTTQHYLKFQPDELKQYFPSLIPIIDDLTKVYGNVQNGNKKMGTQYSNVSKLQGSIGEVSS